MFRRLSPLLALVTGIVTILANRPQRRINVNSKTLRVSILDGPVSINAILSYKGWFSWSFNDIGGTVTVPVRQTVFTVTPSTNTTTVAAPDCFFAVTGISVGTGTFSVSGKSAEGDHGSELIKVTVVA